MVWRGNADGPALCNSALDWTAQRHRLRWLATYVAFHPDVAGSYGRMAGVLAVALFGGLIWSVGRAAIYLLGGD